MSQIFAGVKSQPTEGPKPILLDAHCHLERGYYGSDLPQVMARARQAGLEAFVAVGASGVLDGAREAVALAEGHDDVFASLGIHPCEVHEAKEEDFDALEALLVHPKVVALGEVGLDYYHDASTKPVQLDAFARFVAMSRATHRPLMLHIRDAHADTYGVLDREGLPPQGGMVHCFTAGPEEAQAYLSRGLYLSIPGVVTFKNARALQAAVPMIPADRLLLETDSPYLTPAPHRGKQNEPALVRHTAEAVAALRGTSVEELAMQCADNARRFFGLPDRAAKPSFRAAAD